MDDYIETVEKSNQLCLETLHSIYRWAQCLVHHAQYFLRQHNLSLPKVPNINENLLLKQPEAEVSDALSDNDNESVDHETCRDYDADDFSPSNSVNRGGMTACLIRLSRFIKCLQEK